MKKCPRCGADCRDEEKFCQMCGSPFTTEQNSGEIYGNNAGNYPQDGNGYPNGGYQQNAYNGNPYGNNPNGNAYGNNPNGNPYDNGAYNNNAYGNNGYNNNGYNNNAYGNNGYGNAYGGGGYGAPLNTLGIQQRNIVLAIVLSVVTCGIYGIYWMIKLNDEINQLANEPNATGGGMVFLFSLITCGIYGLYWYYKMGERVERIKGTSGSTAILYLVLAIFGLGIVNYCMMQDTINKSVMM